MVRSATCVLALLISSALSAQSLTFEQRAVVCSGFTQGGEVVLFAVLREPQPAGESNIVQTRLVARDTDGDGTVRFDLGRDVPYLSVWSAVDVRSGAFAVGTKEPFPLRRVAWPSNAVGADTDGSLRKLEISGRGAVDVLWLRPETGAWSMTLYDGGPSDEERRNDGRIRAALDNLRTITGDDPPRHLKKDDILVIIDQRKLEIFAARIEQ